MRLFVLSLAVAAALLPGGCGGPRPADSPGSKERANAPEPEHSHERGKMLIADAGRHHALLTAHLSPKGNELDIFFETAEDDNPTPVALPLRSFTAYAKRAGEEEPRELKFECAPAEERPKGEKPGTCSHFVAKAGWLRPEETITLTFVLELDGERSRVTWKNFVPKKYAHHEE